MFTGLVGVGNLTPSRDDGWILEITLQPLGESELSNGWQRPLVVESPHASTVEPLLCANPT